MNNATKINIADEMDAIGEGQCGHCRLGLTHTHNADCSKKEFQTHYKPMIRCTCGCMHSIKLKKCPDCGFRRK